MVEHSQTGPETSQWLAMLILALWIVLVLVLGLFLLTGRATASPSFHPGLIQWIAVL